MNKRSHTLNLYTPNTTITNTDQHPQQDRLSSLPDILLILILSLIDTKLAVQTSTLSKRWLNLWTLLPILNFDSTSFPLNHTFDSFINNVLTHRNKSIKLEAVNIKVTDYDTMDRVYNYALLNHVLCLSVDCSDYLTKYRQLSCLNPSDCLTSFRLKGMLEFSGCLRFSGLVKLWLERVKLVETEPFSGFVKLRDLSLVNCKMGYDLGGVELAGFELERLRVSSCFYHPIPYEKVVVLAPKLVVLEIEGLIPMEFEACEFPRLETVHVDCCFSFGRVADRNVQQQQPDEEEQKVNLIRMLWCVRNAKCIHLSPSTVKLLTLSESKLVEEPCPFVNLKVLNLIPPPNKPVGELPSSVATYLLKGSPGVVVKSLPR
ncbi:hypothetical protein M8C21_016802 [Ambrosia artemisiifolia]|uniref:F-box domain-containing protein n=1 Tax=Ambrosia artemisiifolia TaxID=4212 RepID=A0AAD5D4C3_AMBAR|nr:hypothetical protein M8C21_016802 [Ambrosia artemisiifolia]